MLQLSQQAGGNCFFYLIFYFPVSGNKQIHIYSKCLYFLIGYDFLLISSYMHGIHGSILHAKVKLFSPIC